MSQTLSTDEIMNIAKLARLGVTAEQADSYANDLSKILSMMDILAEVNTDNIAPLTNVHDMTQPLREDEFAWKTATSAAQNRDIMP